MDFVQQVAAAAPAAASALQPVATVVAAAIGAAASITAALVARSAGRVAQSVERAGKIRQARLDERDLIGRAQGFLIPVENDLPWRDYYDLLGTELRDGKNAATARKDASDKVSKAAPLTANPRVAEPLG